MPEETIQLEGLGEVELQDTPPDQTDHLAKFLIQPKEHVRLLPPKERLKHAFLARKHSQVRFYIPKPSPRKYPTKLHKRLARLDAEFETASPLRQVRILKYATSLTERMESGRAKHVNRRTHKRFRNQGEFYEIVDKVLEEETDEHTDREQNVQNDK